MSQINDIEHAKFAPSSASRWMACPGSIQLCQGIEGESSEYADEGTAAHELAARCLQLDLEAAKYIGDEIDVCDNEGNVRRSFTVDDEMADAVQVYVDSVRDAQRESGGQLLVEQRMDFSPYINIDNQSGTGDAVILTEACIEVHDLKYGKGVKVSAERNKQEMLYGLGALNEFGLLYDNVQHVKLVIHQPRLDHISEYTATVRELLDFGEEAALSAQEALSENPPFNPGVEQCRFCPAHAICTAAADQVHDAVLNSFNSVEDIERSDPDVVARHLGMVEQARNWANAVEKAAKDMLHAGTELPGWKLVQGRAGARQWEDESTAEAELKKMRIKKDDMYTFKLISPTQAEKQLRKKHPQKWEKLSELVTRGKPSISVAPADDPRPALTTSDDFQDLTSFIEGE